MIMRLTTVLAFCLTTACGQNLFNPNDDSLPGRSLASQSSSRFDADQNSVDLDDSGANTDEANSGGNQGKDGEDLADSNQSGGGQDGAAQTSPYCPALDPAVIEQLIASGQPFEVECEYEIEVGQDVD